MAKDIRYSKVKSGAFQKIDLLRRMYSYDDESVQFLNDQEEELRKAIDEASVPKIPAIISLIQDAQKEIDAINHELQNNRKLDDLQRSTLFKARDIFEFWVSRLSGDKAQLVIKNIEEIVDRKLQKNQIAPTYDY